MSVNNTYMLSTEGVLKHPERPPVSAPELSGANNNYERGLNPDDYSGTFEEKTFADR